MKIEAITASPDMLIAAIDKAMNDGDLKTWKIVKADKGQILYTHTPEQWNEKALLTRVAKTDRVVFNINWWTKNDEPSDEVKGIYIGRFSEVLLVHFRNYLSKLEAWV